MSKAEKVDRWRDKKDRRPKPHPDGNRRTRRDKKFGHTHQPSMN